MGTWGTAIFSDDLASDVKGAFRDKIAYGQSPIDATREILEAYQDALEDPDDAGVIWLALALTQWKMGRLQDNVKQKALEIIETGSDLERWQETPKEHKARASVLNNLKEKLLHKQPIAKKIPTPYVLKTKMQAGDVLSYKHSSGNIAILSVSAINVDHCGDTYPRIEILDYFDKSIPSAEKIKDLKRKYKYEDNSNGVFKPSGTYYVAPHGKRDAEPWDKLCLIGKDETRVSERERGTIGFITWRDFDGFLSELFT